MNKHRFWLIVLAVVTSLAINAALGVIAFRVNSNTHSQRTLCTTLVDIIKKSDASLSQFSYYQHHPEELKLAHKQNRDTIKTLNCGAL